MSYDIDKHVMVKFTETPIPEILDNIHTAIENEVMDVDADIECGLTETSVEFRMSGCVSSGFSEVKLLNDIHETSPTIEAVTSIDLSSGYGKYQTEHSDKTTKESHDMLVTLFIEGVQNNLNEILKSMTDTPNE